MPVTGNNPLTSYRLSIRVHAGGFSFVSTDAVTGTVVNREEHALRDGETMGSLLQRVLERPFQKTPKYRSVQLLMDSPSMRIPLEEFRRDEIKALYQLTYGLDNLEGREVRYEILPTLEVAEVFTVDSEVEKLLLKRFPRARAHGYYGFVLEDTVDKDRLREGEENCLYVCTSGRDLFCFSFTPDGRLRFANSFEADTVANQLYYVLYVWKTLGFDQREDVCALVNEMSDLQGQLSKYILKLEECE